MTSIQAYHYFLIINIADLSQRLYRKQPGIVRNKSYIRDSKFIMYFNDQAKDL